MSYRTIAEEVMEGNYDRPFGVKIIAILMILGGIMLIITQLSAFRVLSEISLLIGVSSLFFQVAVGFLGLLGVAGGVGMWLGKKWGWWLAIFYFAYSLTRNFNVLFSIPGITEQYAASGNAAGHYVKYGLRVLWNILLLYYMCRENTTSFFKTTETNKLNALLTVFGICAGIFVIGWLLSFF
ncbi:hypothetical protein [Paenibacillus harenae]|uniref:hypothetical protein n=1 Tax=Paenibacillus harenae TaxID=306543 RepID=UPI00041CAFAF|nr:hypothetical protein [Paenibacillus harenae]